MAKFRLFKPYAERVMDKALRKTKKSNRKRNNKSYSIIKKFINGFKEQ